MRIFSYDKKIYIVLLIVLMPFSIFSQKGILDRQDLLPVVEEALSQTYNFEFDKAKGNLAQLKSALPGHPASYFLEALIIYWENYPMTLENSNSKVFLELMDKTAILGEKMAEENENDPEGVFFALFSRAFYIMFLSDNGKSSKVFPYLNAMYNQMLKGMKMKDKFVEFYFSSGLYNYYIEAYTEKHPVYKPVKILFKSGNKKQGLHELHYCAENAIYLRVEAKYFLSLIFTGYENNISRASEYAAELYNEFPNNICYSGLYAETLLYEKKYHLADVIINNLSKKTDNYSRFQSSVLRGYLLEKKEKDYESAFKEYHKGLGMADEFGLNAAHFQVIAWMGLSRYYRYKGDSSESTKYYRLAKSGTSYDYILNDR